MAAGPRLAARPSHSQTPALNARTVSSHSRTFGIKLGLENIRQLCDALNNPERTLQSLHIAGTTGKGSVDRDIHAAMVAASAWRSAGIPPGIPRNEERFVVRPRGDRRRGRGGGSRRGPRLRRAAAGRGDDGRAADVFEATTAWRSSCSGARV